MIKESELKKGEESDGVELSDIESVDENALGLEVEKEEVEEIVEK
jgi:hypothetical protein